VAEAHTDEPGARTEYSEQMFKLLSCDFVIGGLRKTQYVRIKGDGTVHIRYCRGDRPDAANANLCIVCSGRLRREWKRRKEERCKKYELTKILRPHEALPAFVCLPPAFWRRFWRRGGRGGGHRRAVRWP